MSIMTFFLDLFRAKPTQSEMAERAHITAQIRVATYQQGESARRLERVTEKALNSRDQVIR